MRACHAESSLTTTRMPTHAGAIACVVEWRGAAFGDAAARQAAPRPRAARCVSSLRAGMQAQTCGPKLGSNCFQESDLEETVEGVVWCDM